MLVRHIDAFLFSLLAADILRMEKNRSGDLVFNLSWLNNLTPKYKTTEVWEGLNLRDEESSRNRLVQLRDI